MKTFMMGLMLAGAVLAAQTSPAPATSATPKVVKRHHHKAKTKAAKTPAAISNAKTAPASK